MAFVNFEVFAHLKSYISTCISEAWNVWALGRRRVDGRAQEVLWVREQSGKKASRKTARSWRKIALRVCRKSGGWTRNPWRMEMSANTTWTVQEPICCRSLLKRFGPGQLCPHLIRKYLPKKDWCPSKFTYVPLKQQRGDWLCVHNF